ncbi:MAG: wax ester/triacylglycerol synthase family O-acyltransferase [Pseudomonadales bacterium]|nr:wax ester/triacylglycerol synthase family O-acyltransferase [Pseudomonadales bacterium]
MQQLSGLDAMFVHAEMHGLPMHISTLSIYDPSTSLAKEVGFKDILKLSETRIRHYVPVFRSRLISVPFNLDQPYWEEDENFDMVYHVRHIALPKPGNWEKLCSLVANLHAQPLNRSRPLWEAYVIDGLDSIEGMPKNAFAIMMKVHHSIMDGRTGMAIYGNLHSLQPGEDVLAAQNISHESMGHEVYAQGSPKSSFKLLSKAYTNNLGKTFQLFRLLGRSVSIYSKVQLGLRTKELKTLYKPKTRFNGEISPRRIVDRVCFSLSSIKAIKNCFPDETINDVALTIIGGGLRRYLIAKNELPEDSLVAGVPIDVRPPDDEEYIGNRLNIMNVALRTDISDPIERLQVIHREAKAGKAFAQVLGDDLVTDIMDNAYPGLVSWGIRSAVNSGFLDKFPPVNNTIVTNVPGSPVPLYLCGAKLVESFGMGPLIPNTGLFHTVSTTYDFMTIAFTACRHMMGDPSFYVECLRKSFDELEMAASLMNKSGTQEVTTDADSRTFSEQKSDERSSVSSHKKKRVHKPAGNTENVPPLNIRH